MTQSPRVSRLKISAFAASLIVSLALAAPAGAANDKGKRVFLRCVACHSIERGGANKVGPNLFGIVGRRAGRVKGFSYSLPMTKSGLTWDENTLDKWLGRPSSLVPGTTMAFPGLSNPQDRKAVIDLLKASKP